MLELIPRIIAYKLYRSIGFPRLMPMNYTVSLLYECNSKCSTCNIWKKKTEKLTAAEYGKMFHNIGHSPYWITYSGGEPFLRPDLVDVVKAIYDASHPKIINIPTNGILTKKIVNDVDNICMACPKSQIIINVSLDGIESEHDNIRNVPGNFKKATTTFKKLKSLGRKNLAVGIHTVISQFNVGNFSAIASNLMALGPDSYITEIAEERIELDTIGMEITPSTLAYKSAIDFLIHRIKNGKFKGVNKITMAFRIEYYNLVKKILRDRRQIIPCYSGIASVQISPAGDVWSCCIKAKSFGNLKKNGYDFRKIWFSPVMRKERLSIKNRECWCPLANASYTNMLLDIPTLFRVFYRSFIKWWT
ncbi:MAG TPA: radical SAM protein [Candidatus Cloacimonadota bacterium]|nr:radical SAM protein [Candidatus Cloacimonadota bacterium]HPT72291.1 radical SAM protein [Candidatus Cloacimonadota bacterium]